jgi:hypothetical protein
MRGPYCCKCELSPLVVAGFRCDCRKFLRCDAAQSADSLVASLNAIAVKVDRSVATPAGKPDSMMDQRHRPHRWFYFFVPAALAA